MDDFEIGDYNQGAEIGSALSNETFSARAEWLRGFVTALGKLAKEDLIEELSKS